ncbi:unnamed protein product, partial [Brachionus calyciflorus]
MKIKNSCFLVVNLLFLLIYPTNSQNKTNGSPKNTCLKPSPHIVSITDQEQDDRIVQEEFKCNAPNHSENFDPLKCPKIFDSVNCWEETPVNETRSKPCPNFIQKFNTKGKAYVHCIFDPILSR